MNKLRDTMVYFCQHYPHSHELSKARLTKLIYLADWYAALRLGRQITDIKWEFNYYGPYVNDIINLAESDPLFRVVRDSNIFGERKDVITCVRRASHEHLDDAETKIVQEVIDKTKDMTWDEFIGRIYLSYPVQTQPQFSRLNLVQLAKEKRRVG